MPFTFVDQPNNDQDTHGVDDDHSLTFDDDMTQDSDDSGYTQEHDNLVTRSVSSDISGECPSSI